MGGILGSTAVRRYWIDKNQVQDTVVSFSGDQLHHIFDVCRQDVGSKFEVITADSIAYFVEVTSVSKKIAQAKILETREIPPLPRPHLHLILCVSKFPVMDAVVEKLVEMGVKSITPAYSDYSFLRKENAIPENRIERWKKIVISASQQSGRGDLMEIRAPARLLDLASKINPSQGHLGLFSYEGDTTLRAKEFLNEQISKIPNLSDVYMIIGGEGGFSLQEVKELGQLGLRPVSLGAQVLRVETACMALTSVLKYELDLMR